MEKVRPCCGQPSDRGRLKNRTEQNERDQQTHRHTDRQRMLLRHSNRLHLMHCAHAMQCMHACIHTYIHTYIYVSIYLSMCVCMYVCMYVKKGKGFPYSLPSVGPEADPGVQTDCQPGPRVTISHPPGGRLPLLSTRPAVTFPAAEHHRPLACTKLYCLVTEAHGCEQLAQGCYAAFAPSRI